MENSPEANSDKEFLSKLNLMDENGLKEKTAESSERERERHLTRLYKPFPLPPSPPPPGCEGVSVSFPSHFGIISSNKQFSV